MINDNELERLATDYAHDNAQAGIHFSYAIMDFKAGFKAAEQIMKDRFPSEDEAGGFYSEAPMYYWIKQKLFGDVIKEKP